jgi:hypothetical protein
MQSSQRLQDQHQYYGVFGRPIILHVSHLFLQQYVCRMISVVPDTECEEVNILEFTFLCINIVIELSRATLIIYSS